MSKILEQITHQFNKNLPFVCYRKPKGETLRAYLNRTDELQYSNNYEDQGFLFAPFDDRDKAIIFSLNDAEVLEEPMQQYATRDMKMKLGLPSSSGVEHKSLVSRGVEAINNGMFGKVVLSRKEIAEHQGFDFLEIFKRLLKTYYNAFAYVWYHPKVGMWMGATPERLVSLENNKFVTMALAGTQAYKGDPNPDWGDKEQQEHQFVVDYIVDQIQDPTNGIVLKDFNVSKTYTSKAGNLLHLKADIEGEIGDFNLKALLKTLHPTPAVCGLPKEAAKAFILENEHYHRSFYTGFLGEVNVNDATELFVNLRCAEFTENEVSIYVGGGITKDSNPDKEWVETIRKTQTIKSIL